MQDKYYFEFLPKLFEAWSRNNINIIKYIKKRKLKDECIPYYILYLADEGRKDDLEKPLYRAFKKYGKDSFKWDILEECSNDLLKEREIYWIEYYNTYENREHYNETPGGDCPGRNTVHYGEDHGMAKITEEEVIFCRKAYLRGERSRKIYNKYFSDKISYSGFLRMWHEQTWKHIMPEVFNKNPHPAKYTAADRDILTALFKESGLSLSAFSKTKECYVGYGTLYKMIHTPDFYDGK